MITIYFFSFAYPLNILIPLDTTNLLFHFPWIVQKIIFLKIFRPLSSRHPLTKKAKKIYAGNRIVVMDLQRMLVRRFVRNVIPTRRSGVQIRARFIAPWWKKYTVIKHATRHLSRGQNGRDVSFSPLPE